MRFLKRLVLALLVLAAGFARASAQTLTTLWQFNGTDGWLAYAGLVQGSDGNFYGTTYAGGTNNGGTVFRITPQGTLTNIYQFGGLPTDGTGPFAGLIQGNDGNFYGTTMYGGIYVSGTVFKITSQGTLATLYPLGGLSTDGTLPHEGLVQGSDGNFYGTTSQGGTNNQGTVFKITSQGTLTTLYQFGGQPTDGTGPYASLMQGIDGHFYGTTLSGPPDGYNYGTVFKITSQGMLTTLHQFAGGIDGYSPWWASLVQGSGSNLYGTTIYGGTNSDGTIFKITTQGTLTTLYQLTGGADGALPAVGLVQGSDGNFYGTTGHGGTSSNCTDGCGTVFKITPQGTLTMLYQFSRSDGESPMARLVQGSDGSFYGTTTWGGKYATCEYCGGTVFKLAVPLASPANQISAIEFAGANLVFSIPSVAYETYQLQFSSSMTPTNWVNVPNVSVTNSMGGPLSLTNFGGASQPQGFYRFAITP
jgi:uncharacterized repeat protein (TIGR03803 family)